MALNLQPVNLSGLSALAGNTTSLNLTPTGNLGLQALQIKNARDAALRDDALKQIQLRQQGEIALRNDIRERQKLGLLTDQQQQQNALQQAELGLKQQQLGQQGNQFKDELALKQQQLNQQSIQSQADSDIKKQALFQELQQQQMKLFLAEKKEKIQEKGAYASYGLMSLNDAKTPEEAQLISNEIFKEAVKKGYMDEEQAKQMNQLPLSQRKNMFKMMIMNLGMAKEYKDMQDKQQSTNENTEVVLPDGTVIKTVQSTTADKGRLEKEISGADTNIRELTQMIQKVPDDFFGAAALNQNVTYLRELGQSIPGLGPLIEPSKEAKDSNVLYNSIQSQTKNLSMNIIRDLSGQSYTDKQLEFMNDIVPSVGPTSTRSQFDGKTQNLLRFFKESKAAKQELLKNGYKLDSPEYKERLLSDMQSIARNINEAPKSSGLRGFLEQKGFSKEEIDAELKRRGM